MRKILLGALGLVMVGVIGMYIWINTSDVEAFTFRSVDVHKTKDVSAQVINNILIDSPSVDVNVQPTSGEKIEVDFSGKVGKKSKDLYKLHVEEDGDTVNITMEKEDKFSFMMFNITRVSLEIKIPEKVYQSIEINAASGDISLDEVEAKEVVIETQSGDLKVKNVETGDSLVLKASSGDIIAQDNRSNHLLIESSSGDVRINDIDTKVTEVFASSGNIVSNLLVSEIINMNSSSGNILVDAEEMIGNIFLSTSSGDIDVSFANKITSVKLDYKSSSGSGTCNLDEMNFSEKSDHRMIGSIGNGDYKLTARTSSGDFKLNN